MARRFFVPACTLSVFLGLLVCGGQLFAQDDPAKKPPTGTGDGKAAEEKAATSKLKPDGKEAAKATPVTPKVDAAPQKTPPKPETDAPPQKTPPKPDVGKARADFDAKFQAWKDKFVELRKLRHDYQTADEAGRAKIASQWDETKATMWATLPDLTAAGAKAYQAAPNEDRELTVWLVKMLQDFVAHDQYDQAVRLGGILIDNQCDDPQIFRDAGIANFALHNFDDAAALLDKATNALTGEDKTLRGTIESYKEHWVKEQEARTKEGEKNDLPRVKLTTNKGEILFELFENEAPDTVGNFISLVKNGFYDGLTFHRVIAGFMAQAGCPEGDGSGGPGYNIYDECDKPDTRMHFRGCLSMAKTGLPNSGGSQFFITFCPTPHLNNVHTVFGRVLEGMDVVDKLQRREPTKDDAPPADKIVKAEVVRDRGHEYLPKKVD